MRVIKTLIMLISAAAIVAWLCYSFWVAYQPVPPVIQGQIEAQQYNISSKVAGRLEKILVKKGDIVKKGQLVFTIYSPEIEAKLDQARAGKDTADAMVEQTEKGARTQEIGAARDKWQQAKAATDLLEITFKRIENLYRDGVIAEQKRDEAATKLKAARYTENAALQLYQMTREGAREETKKAVAGKARMAAGAVAEVEAYAADTRIVSLFNGEVSQLLLQAGELAPQGFPVVTVIDMKDSWAVFHIREDNLSKYNKGQEFKARIPALGEEIYTFKVSHVAVMGDFATWRATNTSKGFDMRTFEVEARPPAPIDNLRVGMSVIVAE
ncbi:MAG: efflux RND transporter periplasmic adaptor subunit [Deltaproteobacteria bacterium]|nr:efflux RND transporter periplasmic adaptor subunit [Deltaproteobacteria bacterium]MBW2658969.1 efflux RND transporter periplasmic adaptor subunit [Deltaproteobacteria bacterium]